MQKLHERWDLQRIYTYLATHVNEAKPFAGVKYHGQLVDFNIINIC